MLRANLPSQEEEQVFRGVGDGYVGGMGRRLKLRAPRIFSSSVSPAVGRVWGQEDRGRARTYSPRVRTPCTHFQLGLFFLWSVAQVLPATHREFKETG